MAGFRKDFINCFGFISNFWTTKQLISWSKLSLLLPVYHTISDQELPHISGLYCVKNTLAFEKDLDYLLKYFKPINLDQLMEKHEGENQFKHPSFLLTFDDGLSEFHDVIVPILERKGLTAICFLNSAFIDNKALFYRYKASVLINHLEQHPKSVNALSDVLQNTRYFKKFLHGVSYQDRQILDHIANKLEVDFNQYLKERQPYLNSEQINSLLKKGFHFGAHSVDHPEYQHLVLKDQVHQTTKSVDYVCKNFNLKERLFAFPFTDYGVGNEFFEYIKKANVVDLSFGSAGLKKENIKTHLQRVPFEMENLTAKKILKSEMLYTGLRKIASKDMIVR